jgi:hypothetical protein
MKGRARARATHCDTPPTMLAAARAFWDAHREGPRRRGGHEPPPLALLLLRGHSRVTFTAARLAPAAAGLATVTTDRAEYERRGSRRQRQGVPRLSG